MKKISRKAAIAKGQHKYFDGKPCPQGHVSPRYVRSCSCVQCHARTFARRYWKGRDRVKYQAAYYRRVVAEAPERIMFQSAKIRARQYGVPFSLTVKDVKSLWPKDGLCPVLEIPLQHSVKSTGGMSVNSPSLDRIVPGKGYVLGNVAIISVRANRIKSNETDPEAIRKVADWLERSSRSA